MAVHSASTIPTQQVVAKSNPHAYSRPYESSPQMPSDDDPQRIDSIESQGQSVHPNISRLLWDPETTRDKVTIDLSYADVLLLAAEISQPYA